MAIWAILAMIFWLAGASGNLTRIAVAGLIVGIPGLLTMVRHDANRRRRRAADQP
jgi:hypothetical protein